MDLAGRDRFLDLLRGGSIVAVVVGHWLVADVRWSQADLADTSALAEVPGMWPVTWVFLVIPLFFFVGGYANHRTGTALCGGVRGTRLSWTGGCTGCSPRPRSTL